MRHLVFAVVIGAAVVVLASSPTSTTIEGYVLDSACAYTKSLDKPISAACAKQCAKGGSALVILANDGTVYWPIDAATPAKGQNAKLLPFAGQKVSATGKVHERGGSKAMVIEKVAPLK